MWRATAPTAGRLRSGLTLLLPPFSPLMAPPTEHRFCRCLRLVEQSAMAPMEVALSRCSASCDDLMGCTGTARSGLRPPLPLPRAYREVDGDVRRICLREPISYPVNTASLLPPPTGQGTRKSRLPTSRWPWLPPCFRHKVHKQPKGTPFGVPFGFPVERVSQLGE